MKLPVVKYRFVEETARSDVRRQSLLCCIAVYIIEGYCCPALPVVGVVATCAVKLIGTSFVYCVSAIAIKTQGDLTPIMRVKRSGRRDEKPFTGVDTNFCKCSCAWRMI